MSKRLELQIQGSGGNFAFDVEGEWTPRIEPVYRTTVNPPELEQLLWTWEFRGCRLKTSDGSDGALWTSILAFFDRFEDRNDHPTYVRLVRDPSGSATEVLRLEAGDDGDYEGLRFTLIEGAPDPQLPSASWSKTGTFNLQVEAVRKFADVNGVVSWDQEASVGYTNGLRVLEWVTTIRTAEGTSAVTKAKALAAIDITELGDTYTYRTNGPDGIEWDELDADNARSPVRTPTYVRAISRVQEWGVSIGATGPGVAVDEPSLTVRTQTTSDATITTTSARASGPNAEQWVRSQAPGGTYYEEVYEESPATNEFSARWEKRTTRSASAVANSRIVKVQISGGKRIVRTRVIANGLPPIIQRGGFIPLTAKVAITVKRTGGTGAVSELKLPPLLGDPWILDPGQSSEEAPVIADRGSSPDQHVWERSASLVYVAATAPEKRPSVELAAGNDVDSYHLNP